MDADAALGRRGENLAHRYLRACGMTVIARNVRLPDGSGEIDIVARDGAITVFVEVKARMTDAFGAPERAINKAKQERITRAARFYASRSGVTWDRVRFDVVSIVFTKPPSVSHYVDAFFLGRVM
jgi:putative endonuclease